MNMADALTGFVANVLEARADKSWTPVLFASSDFAKECPSIGGLIVTPDATLVRTLEIRLSPADFGRMKAESPLQVTSDVAARVGCGG